MAAPICRFLHFRLDPQARELRADGALVHLPASAFDCLCYLVEQRDRAVGRDELVAAVWGRTEIGGKLLEQTILKIRRTLGDTAAESHCIRTVARFGYRWVAPTTPDVEATPPDPALADVAVTADAVAVRPRSRVRRTAYWAGGLLAGGLLLGLGLAGLRAPVPSPPAVATKALPAAAAPAMVLPVEVRAGSEWDWLRLGLMDLVAGRLRDGGLATLSSESVVGLLRDGRPAATADAAAPQPIRVEASRAGDRWNVRLETVRAGTPAVVEAQSGDVLLAGRQASDALLVLFGHTPPEAGDPPPRALQELLQRAHAAVLGERFAAAARLIEQAPPDLAAAPEVDVLMAYLEIRSGSYRAAEQRLRQLLDRGAGTLAVATRARALNALAALHVRADQPDPAMAAYSEAIDLLAGGGEPSVLGYAYMGRAMVASMVGELDAATADLGRARIEMEAAGDSIGSATVDLSLGQIQMRRRDATAALNALRAAERGLEPYSAREELVYARLFKSEVELRLLDTAAARATSDRFWPAETATANERLRWHLVLARARVLAAQGALAEAETLLQAIRDGASTEADAGVRAETEAVAAALVLLRDRPEQAVAQARLASTAALENSAGDVYLANRLVLLGALVRSQRLAEAEAENAGLQTWLDQYTDGWHRAYGLLADAEVAVARGAVDTGLGHYAQALQALGGNPEPADAVAIAEPYLHALIDAGRIDEASARMAELAPYADADVRITWAQARLYAALERPVALQRAYARAVALAGERRLSPPPYPLLDLPGAFDPLKQVRPEDHPLSPMADTVRPPTTPTP